MQPSNDKGLPFDEVVDTLGDALEVTEKVQKAASDGLGLGDLGTLFEVTPTLNEIRRDAPVFVAQLQDLTDDEAEAAATQLAARTGQSKSGIVQRATEAVQLAADIYTEEQRLVALYGRIVAFGKAVVHPNAA